MKTCELWEHLKADALVQLLIVEKFRIDVLRVDCDTGVGLLLHVYAEHQGCLLCPVQNSL